MHLREIMTIVEMMGNLTEGAYQYVTNCMSDLHGPYGQAIHDMVENAEIIDYDDVENAVGRDALADAFPDYDWSDHPKGLTLKNDWAVSYGRSVWRNTPCVYVEHSRVEYIFTLGGKMGPLPEFEDEDDEE